MRFRRGSVEGKRRPSRRALARLERRRWAGMKIALMLAVMAVLLALERFMFLSDAERVESESHRPRSGSKLESER